MDPYELEWWQWREKLSGRVTRLEADLKSDEQRRDQIVKNRAAQVSLFVSVCIGLLTALVLYFTRR